MKAIIWVVVIGGMLVLFRPTAILLAVGLIPTLLTLLFDRTPEKFGVLCIGSLNLAGMYPILMPLWTHGHTMERAMKTLGNPTTGAVILGAAGVGCAIYFATPPLVTIALKYKIGREIADLEARQKELVAYWGDALTEDAGMSASSESAPSMRPKAVRRRH